jgi:hypothetical protein
MKEHQMSRNVTNNSSGNWTIRKVPEPARGPVTRETVKELSRDRSLRGVAQIAKKYAS